MFQFYWNIQYILSQQSPISSILIDKEDKFL